MNHSILSNFKRCYGYSSPSKCAQLLATASSVLLGIKPALLVDCVQPDPGRLQSFLQASLHHHLSTSSHITPDSYSNLCILTINGDILLVHKDTISLNHHLKPCYVNITRGLNQPELVSQTHNQTLLDEIEAQLFHWIDSLLSSVSTTSREIKEPHPVKEQDRSSGIKQAKTVEHTTQGDDEKTRPSSLCCRSIPNNPKIPSIPIIPCDEFMTDTDVNVCMLFGWLLGYPVVYWFDMEVGYSLEMEELVCHHVTVYSDSGQHGFDEKGHTLYSFTVPKCILPAAGVQDVVDTWFHRVRTMATRLELGVRMDCTATCQPSVIL